MSPSCPLITAGPEDLFDQRWQLVFFVYLYLTQRAETFSTAHVISTNASPPDAQSGNTKFFTGGTSMLLGEQVVFSAVSQRRRSELAFSSHSPCTLKTQVLVFVN